jgi:WhiB family redox-sensing transcriptional regulator
VLHPPHQSLQVAAVPPQPVPVRERDQEAPWHTEAVCRRDEAGLFFAPSKEPTAARLSREEAAKRVCGRCPVMVECREHALLQPEPYGVWGGPAKPTELADDPLQQLAVGDAGRDEEAVVAGDQVVGGRARSRSRSW